MFIAYTYNKTVIISQTFAAVPDSAQYPEDISVYWNEVDEALMVESFSMRVTCGKNENEFSYLMVYFNDLQTLDISLFIPKMIHLTPMLNTLTESY